MSSQENRSGLTRRDMMAKTAGVLGGTAAVGAGAEYADVSPVGEARAVVCGGVCLAVGGAVAVAGGVGIGYMMRDDIAAIVGDNKDYSNYTGADALHDDIVAGALELQSVDERVLTSIENNVKKSQNVALAKGKAAAIEAMNNGKSESVANDKMASAIDGYYSTIQANLLKHWDAQRSQVQHYVSSVKNHSNLSQGDVFSATNVSGSVGIYQDTTPISVTLLDGSVMDYYPVEINITNSTTTNATDPLGKFTASKKGGVTVKERTSTSEHLALGHKSIGDGSTNPVENGEPWNALLYERDDVNAQLSGFIGDVYAAYEPGEIPTADLVDPITASTQLRQNYEGLQAQGAHAAMLGIESSAERSVDIEVNPNSQDSQKLTVDIYTEYSPSNGFQAGNTYEPSTWNKPLYIAYEATVEQDDGTITTESDFVQLSDPFFIVDIVEQDGTSISSFQPESQNIQTADIATIQEELAQIREEQIRLQEEAQGTTGGGGVLSSLGGDSTAIVALVGAGAAAMYGLTNGD